MAPLQQRLLGDGKIQSICGCRTMARTCVTSFCVRWRARGAEPSLSRTHRGWVWRMASDLGASGVLQACTTPIVRRREKSSISEILAAGLLAQGSDDVAGRGSPGFLFCGEPLRDPHAVPRCMAMGPALFAFRLWAKHSPGLREQTKSRRSRKKNSMIRAGCRTFRKIEREKSCRVGSRKERKKTKGWEDRTPQAACRVV